MESRNGSTYLRDLCAVFMALALVVATCCVVPTVAHAAAKKPGKPKISKVTSPYGGALTVKVKKAKNAKGYEYKVGLNKALSSGAKSAKAKGTSYTFGGLQEGKTYFVKVRGYNGNKYGAWSAAKKVAVKGGAATVSGVAVDSPYAKFNAGAAKGLPEGIKVDYSNAPHGYVGVKGTSGKKLKVQVKKSGTYTYDCNTNGSIGYYPLNMDNGRYTVEVLRNTSGNRYAPIGSVKFNVTMTNAYQPFMHNNWYVSYGSGSSCVSKAKSLCAGKGSDTARVSAIYSWLTKNIKYDYSKARSVTAGYTPNPDSTLKSKKGICFDYASLAAAMMRSQGIPCRVVTGYVAPKDLYHAWNLIYVKNVGWITTEIKAQNSQWGRIDITYAATGANSKFIGNGKNYTTRYIY